MPPAVGENIPTAGGLTIYRGITLLFRSLNRRSLNNKLHASIHSICLTTVRSISAFIRIQRLNPIQYISQIILKGTLQLAGTLFFKLLRTVSQFFRHIGQLVDCPAGDTGVGGREVGYMFGQYKRLTNSFQGGMLTGKGLTFGGSLARTEATGYGLCYFTAEALKCMRNDSFQGKAVVISGSGNVAIYACEKATQLGAKVVTMSDSNGYVYDPNGIDLAYVKDLKEVRRGRIKEYAETHKDATYVADCSKVWTVPCDIALPCATQNEINKESAEALVKGGCTVVCEGANMPSTPEAIEVYLSNGILYGPAKASNAGGVATSGLEMSQNSERLSWTFEEVDAKLKGIMEGIFHASYDASVAAGSEGNLMVGANCAGFLKVATAMMAQGITY